jgi:cob(I)alamin adenosyltransferase
MKIYTRKGDDGSTGLFGGGRVRKDAIRVAAYGAVDEINAAVGLARSSIRHGVTARTSRRGEMASRKGPATGDLPAGSLLDLDALLARIQNDLFDLGADLATPPGVKAAEHVRRIESADARYLEEAIDRIEGELEPLEQFILPGGVPLAAHLHLARVVCRRAERETVTLAAAESVGEGVLVFLNRLSDLLFVMGRAANHRANEPEPRWTPRGR